MLPVVYHLSAPFLISTLASLDVCDGHTVCAAMRTNDATHWKEICIVKAELLLGLLHKRLCLLTVGGAPEVNRIGLAESILLHTLI